VEPSPAHRGQAVSERSAAAGDLRRRERGITRSAADNDSVVGSLKVSRSDLEQNFSSLALTGFSNRRGNSGEGANASPVPWIAMQVTSTAAIASRANT
jgi:hypothetical protein